MRRVHPPLLLTLVLDARQVTSSMSMGIAGNAKMVLLIAISMVRQHVVEPLVRRPGAVPGTLPAIELPRPHPRARSSWRASPRGHQAAFVAYRGGLDYISTRPWDGASLPIRVVGRIVFVLSHGVGGPTHIR